MARRKVMWVLSGVVTIFLYNPLYHVRGSGGYVCLHNFALKSVNPHCKRNIFGMSGCKIARKTFNN